MLTIISAICVGAVLAVGYALGRTSDGYRKAIAVIRETPINESDAAMRRARAEAIGYQKGLRISACMIAAPVGAIIGLALGLVAWVVGL